MNPTLRAFLYAILFGSLFVALVVGIVAWLARVGWNSERRSRADERSGKEWNR